MNCSCVVWQRTVTSGRRGVTSCRAICYFAGSSAVHRTCAWRVRRLRSASQACSAIARRDRPVAGGDLSDRCGGSGTRDSVLANGVRAGADVR